jgi:hypothetical protein
MLRRATPAATFLGFIWIIYENRFFEISPTARFQKTDFGVSSTCGTGNTKIDFIMKIADALLGFIT